MIKLSSCILVGLAFAFNALPPSFAIESRELPPSITVTGEGHAFARPDQASIFMGVVSDSKTAAVALKDNSTKMSALIKTLTAKGVADKDILTSNFSVNPEYRNDNVGGQNRSTIIGYHVSNDVQVKIRNLPNLGDILDSVITAGANNINSINFSLAEPASVLDQAREKAVTDAKRKAELYASAAGVKLGRVLHISESGGFVRPPSPMMFSRAMAASEAVPISSGEQESTATITIIYGIE